MGERLAPEEKTEEAMAEQFLTLMADLDGDSQKRLSGWYGVLQKARFLGTQTPGLPYHMSLATFPLARESEAVALMQRAAERFPAVPVHFSHIGLFAGGKVLFCAPERNARLDALHGACEPDAESECRWTPHVTLLIDEPETVCAALPVLLRGFSPFVGKLTRLHLCAFWPTREIAAFEMNGKENGAASKP